LEDNDAVLTVRAELSMEVSVFCAILRRTDTEVMLWSKLERALSWVRRPTERPRSRPRPA